jgi:hypothetical protein
MERTERRILSQLAIPDPYRPVRTPRRTSVKRVDKLAAKRPQKSA